LKGKYPKEFKFVGWHPQCRCYAVPVLLTNKEFDELELLHLNDEDTSEFQSSNQVTDVPKGFNKWVADNKERVSKHSSTPYFIKDNFKDGKIEKGLKDFSSGNKQKANTVDSDEVIVMNDERLREAYNEIVRRGLNKLPAFKKHTPAEISVLNDYSDGGYGDLNKELLKGNPSNFHKAYENVLNSALGKLPKERQRYVFRGLGMQQDDAEAFISQFKDDAAVTFSAFTSSSMSYNTAMNFTDTFGIRMFMQIKHKTGKNINGISKFGENYLKPEHQEYEVLIKSKSKFKLLDVLKTKGVNGGELWKIILEQVE